MGEGFLSFPPHLFHNPQKGMGAIPSEAINANDETGEIRSMRQHDTPHDLGLVPTKVILDSRIHDFILGTMFPRSGLQIDYRFIRK